MRVIGRNVWSGGTREPRWNAGSHTVDHVEVHHAAGPVAKSREHGLELVRGIYDFHTGTKRWSDIFYHLFVVPVTGDIIEGRPIGTISEEPGALAVCCLGNFEVTEAVRYPRMLETLREVADEVGGRAAIDWHQARGERRGRHQSACPGRTLIREVARIKSETTPTPEGDDMTPEQHEALIHELRAGFALLAETELQQMRHDLALSKEHQKRIRVAVHAAIQQFRSRP